MDVRVACAAEAKNAPYLVALLGNPDSVVQDEQEDEELVVLDQQKQAEESRAKFVRAQEEAEQQRQLAAAE